MSSLLKINQLTLRTSKKILCRDISFQIQPGEIWGILGPNGGGKTTLLHTLAGLAPIAHGDIFLQGENIRFLSRKKIAQKIGILFQEHHDIFPQTTWDMCRSGRYPHNNTIDDETITKQALLDMDLSKQIHQVIQTLSGGERKRLRIATLLTQSPLIYLLDEPMNHLDLHYQVKILNHFRSLARNKSVSILMALHDVNIAAYYCQKILLLGNGEYLFGEPNVVLTSQILSRLYQHPIKPIHSDTVTWWQPQFDTWQ